MKKIILRIFLILWIGGMAYLFNRFGILRGTLDWIAGSGGLLGPWLFLMVYLFACIFFVPSFVFTFSGGILFGFWKGFILSLLGTGLGSLASFWIGRYLAHGWVEDRMKQSRKFQRLAQALVQKGWKVLVLARLSPIFPFSIGNYAFGLTRIRSAEYFLAAILGTIPSALAYTYPALGALAGNGQGRSGASYSQGLWQRFCWFCIFAALPRKNWMRIKKKFERRKKTHKMPS